MQSQTYHCKTPLLRVKDVEGGKAELDPDLIQESQFFQQLFSAESWNTSLLSHPASTCPCTTESGVSPFSLWCPPQQTSAASWEQGVLHLVG